LIINVYLIIIYLVTQHIFTAESNSEFVVSLPSPEGPEGEESDRKFKYIALVGLGEDKSADKAKETQFRRGKKCNAAADDSCSMLGRKIFALSSRMKARSVDLMFMHLDYSQRLPGMVHGIYEASYEDSRFRKVGDKEEPKFMMSSLSILHKGKDVSISESLQNAQHIASGVKLARELVGAPANATNPFAVARVASEIAAEHAMECRILGEEECRARGMGAYLAVQQGSKFPPQFVHLTYKPPTREGEKNTKIVLVGKGVTFDSGGYNLKVGANSSIEMMKMDMGGCAAVLGCAKAIGQLQPDNVEVHFLSAVCENMISANAVRPGDVVTASNGKTIEVVNTDAEGRLTLADALVYAQSLGDVDAVIDLATLTGAVVVGLGDKVAGLYSSENELLESLMSAAADSGEKVWPLPLEESYRERIKSPIANIQNVGGSGGAGSITAALFLQEFVEKGTAWAHIDIAGPVWDDKENKPTGFGVKMLVDYIVQYRARHELWNTQTRRGGKKISSTSTSTVATPSEE
jgi:leucyl aminopeptidase